MIRTTALIVGGGPAGSACAWKLRQAGVDCLVLDQQRFPRLKTCAGWINPTVVRDLQLDPAEYPHSFSTFTALYMSFWGRNLKVNTRQHAIRRIEFDDWLLKRSGAPVHTHAVKIITPVNGGYEVDGEYFAKYLVGAGGTYCPVYRGLFKPGSPKDRGSLIAAQEEEFRYDFSDDKCRLWFFDNGLPGYAWYVPKANGYVNVGVGGKAEELNAKGDHLKKHWAFLVEKLEQMGLVCNHSYQPSAHTYYLRQGGGEVRLGNAFLVGDSAGLATLDMGEGISAAVKSGLLAAEAILGGGDYALKSIPRYSLVPGVLIESLTHPFGVRG